MGGALATLIFFAFLSNFLMITACLDTALTGHLPNEDFWPDVLDVALYSFIIVLLSLTCIGILAIPFMLSKHYRLACGETAIVILIAYGISIAAGIMLYIPLMMMVVDIQGFMQAAQAYAEQSSM